MSIHVVPPLGGTVAERLPESWQINIKVEEQEETTLLIATSHQLPGLLAVGTCEEDLAEQLPDLIEAHCRRRFRLQVRVRCAGAPDSVVCGHCSRQWVAVPQLDREIETNTAG